jgi:hypothetical protein
MLPGVVATADIVSLLFALAAWGALTLPRFGLLCKELRDAGWPASDMAECTAVAQAREAMASKLFALQVCRLGQHGP